MRYKIGDRVRINFPTVPYCHNKEAEIIEVISHKKYLLWSNVDFMLNLLLDAINIVAWAASLIKDSYGNIAILR